MANNSTNSLLSVINTLWRWRKPIIIFCMIAAIGSVIISLVLPTYYKSYTIFLPANPELSDPVVLSGKYEDPIPYFGEEEDVDRILTIANSVELINFAVQEFDLYNHYDIDTTDEKAPYKVQQKFLKLYDVKKDENGGIELSLEDKDKEFVAKVLKALRWKIDMINRQFSKSSQASIIKSYEEVLLQKQIEMKELGDSLTKLRNTFGIFDVESQGEFIGELVPETESKLAESKAKLQSLEQSGASTFRDSITLLKANISGLRQKLSSLKSSNLTSDNFTIAKFNAGRTDVLYIEGVMEEMTDNLAGQRETFLQYKTAVNTELSTLYVVEEAAVPVVKSWPIRWLIVISACMLAFILSIAGALLLENYKDVDWKKVLSDETHA